MSETDNSNTYAFVGAAAGRESYSRKRCARLRTAAPTKRTALALALLLATLSACTPIATKPDLSPIPDEPITEHTQVGDCDNNVLSDYAGNKKRGSSSIRCTKEITDISSLIDTLKPGSTLLVLDIDDTLLTADTFFGSDSWYDWLKKDSTPANAKPLCKLDIVALNYEAGTQHAVEEEAGVDFVNDISVPKLLLTSRGADYRGGTERELLAAGYHFPANFLDGNDGISWIDHDTTEKVVDAPVSYANGIEMVTGHKKGKTLIELFDRLKALEHPQKFKNIIFVDDGAKNINSLHAYLPKAGFNYYGYWYRRVVKGPAADTDDVDKALAALGEWQGLVKERYTNRWVRWTTDNPAGCGK